jgi:chitosanase
MRSVAAILVLLALGVCAPSAAAASDLASPAKKEIAMSLVSSAENSSLKWREQYRYIEDIHDGRGYTAGIIGFCSGTGDMLELVRRYTRAHRRNPLRRFIPALRRVNGTDSHAGLGRKFVKAWRRAAKRRGFQRAQNGERDRVYFNPSVALAKADGLNALGQFAYYDAAVVHGFDGMRGVRQRALARAATPAQGGDETAYLEAFLDERVVEMRKEAAHEDVTRIETAQRRFLREGNLDLNLPLRWAVYGDSYGILK